MLGNNGSDVSFNDSYLMEQSGVYEEKRGGWCGPPNRDPAVATWSLNWWTNVLLMAVVGLLIAQVATMGAMGYGLVSTAPQLERTTEYTHDMKVTAEKAIGDATQFYEKRMAEFPPNQMDMWFNQFSMSLQNIDHILAAIKGQVDSILDDPFRLVHTATTAAVHALVIDDSKAAIQAMFLDVGAIVSKYRAAADLLTPDEIAAAFRSGSKLVKDGDDILSAIGQVLNR